MPFKPLELSVGFDDLDHGKVKMWNIETPWFDTAIILAIFAVGNILFGHFEEHKPKWRRLLKVVIVLVAFVCISTSVGRGWAFGLLTIPIAAAIFIHCWWLPKNGINGWTGEPKEQYYNLIGHEKRE